MTTTLRIAAPDVNGNLEVGLAVGLDSGLPEGEHLPILKGKAIADVLQNIVNWLATQFPSSSSTEFRLHYAGAFAIMASGLLCLRSSGGNEVPDGDWRYTDNATAPPQAPSQALKDAVAGPLTNVEVADVLIGILSTKVNWWQTNHHTGQGRIQGYALKVLSAKWPSQNLAAMTTLFHRMGHWTSTIAVLRLAGIRNLLMDEIYMKKFWDYKGGSIVGSSHNSTPSAGSAHVFMISSVKSKFKDVVHILPVSTITAEVLHSYLKRIVIGLEDIGYKVIAVISDNNRINSKAMSYFATPPQKQIVYPHPSDSQRPLFFVLDTVHILKCVRNCWLRQKNEDQSMFYPKFTIENTVESPPVQTACLGTLKKLHSAEVNSLAKFGYSLTFKALAPSNLERQNVKLALQIFNEHVVQGLMEMGTREDLIHYEETANYIQIICTWWDIVNVRSPFTGTRLNNIYQCPLTNDPSDVKYMYLSKLIDWLDACEKMQSSCGRCNPVVVSKLSRETHSALKHSTYALMEVTSYCVNELNFKYILPGKFQTDDLESRFGMYRSLAGSQYHVSLRQLYECETKLRLQSHLKLSLSSKKYGDIPLDAIPSLASENDKDNEDNYHRGIDIDLFPKDFEDAKECLPVLVYIAGYCAFSVVKRLKCEHCKSTLLLEKKLPVNDDFVFINKMDRGGLSYPNENVVTVVTTNYVIVKKLCFELENEFLKFHNQRTVAAALTMNNLSFLEDEQCVNGHETRNVMKMIVWSSTNCFLNNYCKKQNNVQRGVSTMKRKFQTFLH